MGKAIIWFIFCMILIVGPWFIPGMNNGAKLIIAFIGVFLLLGGVSISLFWKLYMRTKANEAFVRTGMSGQKVIVDGGSLVFPAFHEVVRVPLETMRLDVDRTGVDALITADKLRADLKAEFYIRVQPNKDDILNAARSLGEKTFSLRSIEELVRDKLVSTLRAAAATRTLDELNGKREEFASQVKKGVESDLRHNGLTLETVTISKLDQTDPKLLNPNNVFDAQGLRRIAEITQNALVERNQIERDAEKARTEKDVETRQQILELERTKASAEATQKAKTIQFQAEREAEARKTQIEQEQLVAEREIEKQRAMQDAQIQAQKKIIQSQREQSLIEVEKEKSVEMANRDKQSSIAEAESRRAEAERLRFQAEAERAKAEQAIKTVEVTASAEREGEQKLIAAKKAAEQERYRKQVEADIVAYTLQKEAEGKKAAAQAEYEAKVRQAEAEAEAARKRAEGETAAQMIAVNVARKQVEVEAAKVDVEQQRVQVEAQSLENREKYGKAAIEFELNKLHIQAEQEIQVATAQALGEFLAKSNFTMFGDPESAQKMVQAYFKGMGLGRTIQGFMAGTNGETKQILGKIGGDFLDLARNIAEKVAGRSVSSDEVEHLLSLENGLDLQKGNGQDNPLS